MESKDRLKPVTDFHKSRRNLPHFELPDSIYFITFSTVNRIALSNSAKDIVLLSLRFHDDRKYALLCCVIMNDHVHCILQPMRIIDSAQARRPVQLNKPSQLNIQEQPPISQTLEYFSLAQIVHSIKSYSANRLQRLLNMKGSIWQD
jgi:REP element-mobilizing transposase RayT